MGNLLRLFACWQSEPFMFSEDTPAVISLTFSLRGLLGMVHRLQSATRRVIRASLSFARSQKLDAGE
jgi:hypothetical protein